MNRLIFLIIFLALNAAVAVAQNKSENTIIKIGEKNYYIHTIVSGETVSSISRRYNVLPRDIVDEFIEEVITRIEDYKTPSVLAESAVKIDDAFKNVGVEALTKAIPNCWISIKSKEEQQAAIKYYAEKLVSLGLGAQIGGGAPSEDFYY